jgi:hypothetical protein
MQMVKSRVTIDSSKVVFQTASSLTCNLRNRQLLAREMEVFHTRESIIHRVRLKLIGVNVFVRLLKRVRRKHNARIQVDNEHHGEKLGNFYSHESTDEGSGLRHRRSSSMEKLTNSVRRLSSIRYISNITSINRQRHAKQVKLNKMLLFAETNKDVYIDQEMIDYKEFIQNCVVNPKTLPKDEKIAPLGTNPPPTVSASPTFRTKKSNSILEQFQKHGSKVSRASGSIKSLVNTTVRNTLRNTLRKGVSRNKSELRQFRAASDMSTLCCARTPRFWDNPKPIQFVGEAPYAFGSLVLVLMSAMYTTYEILTILKLHIGNWNNANGVLTILELTIENVNKTMKILTILETTIENHNETNKLSTILKLTIGHDNKTNEISTIPNLQIQYDNLTLHNVNKTCNISTIFKFIIKNYNKTK